MLISPVLMNHDQSIIVHNNWIAELCYCTKPNPSLLCVIMKKGFPSSREREGERETDEAFDVLLNVS